MLLHAPPGHLLGRCHFFFLHFSPKFISPRRGFTTHPARVPAPASTPDTTDEGAHAMTYGDAIASAAPSPLEGFDRRGDADPPAAHEPALTSTSYAGTSRALPRGRPAADPSRADVPSVFLELLV